jgi:redox-sensitive bicupin YhaK (pirin superfamily)
MYSIRRSNERGEVKQGWLHSYHTFSFGHYYDPNHRGFRNLRVINDDFVKAGEGFPFHPHNDMEIVTYMIYGELKHQDSLGNSAVIKRGEVQYMCAGSGIVHSEFNPQKELDCRLLQIWLIPSTKDLKPSYGQKDFSENFTTGKLTLVLSPNGEADSISLHQNTKLWVGHIESGELTLPLASQRHGWLHLVDGEIEFQGEILKNGDAIAFSEVNHPQIKIHKKSEFLFFDLV